MKRIGICISILALLLSLSACSPAPVPESSATASTSELDWQPSPPLPREPMDFYRKTLDHAFELLLRGDAMEDLEDWEWPLAMYAGSGTESVLSQVGYALTDLSGDGKPELVIASVDDEGTGNYVHALYTQDGLEPSLTLYSWARSGYTWLGDGKLFYSGSNGAGNGMIGVYRLSQDGKSLQCQDCWQYLYGEGEGAVYHNTTGSWLLENSEKLSIEPDMLFEIQAGLIESGERLPLTRFSAYTPSEEIAARLPAWKPLVTVSPAPANANCVVLEDGEYATDIQVKAQEELGDLRIYRLSLWEDYGYGVPMSNGTTVYHQDTLASGESLAIRLVFPGDTPAYAISYADKTGRIHDYALDISGRDGSLLLIETEIDRRTDQTTWGDTLPAEQITEGWSATIFPEFEGNPVWMSLSFNEEGTVYMSYGPYVDGAGDPVNFYEGTWEILPWEGTPGPKSVVSLELHLTNGTAGVPSRMETKQYIAPSEYDAEGMVLYYVDGDELIPGLGSRGITCQKAMG